MAKTGKRSKAAAKRDLAARLRGARLARQISTVDAAKALGVRRPAISEMESGLRDVGATELLALAKLYGVGVDYLLDEPSRFATQERSALAAEVLAHLDDASLGALSHAIAIVQDRRKKSSTFMQL